MNNELVSVVIPCYRQAHWLSEAVQSCLDQTYPRVEIIVVDDGSPDDVKGTLRPFGEKVRLIEQENQGLAAARNTGLGAASGKYVKFLDADDWLLPHCIEQQVASLQGLDNYISVVGYRFHFDDSQREYEDVYPNFGRFSHALCYANTGPPQTFLFSIESLHNCGGFHTGSLVDGGHEDYEMLCRLAAAGVETVVLHTIGCVYRQYRQSMSMHSEKMRRTRSKVWRAYAKLLLKQDCAADLLVHLVGGFGERLRREDFRYEAVPVLRRISEKMAEMTANIPQATTVMLTNELSFLLKSLPQPKSPQEHHERDGAVQIIEDLTSIVLLRITADSVIRENPVVSLVNLADAYMSNGLNRCGRKVLARAFSLNSSSHTVQKGISLLLVLSKFLPGKLAASIWRSMRYTYEVYFLNR